MVTEQLPESQLASESEMAQAAQEAVAQHQRQEVQGYVPGAQEMGALKPMQYKIRPADEAAWVLVWELQKDRDGNEYGIPRMAPRQQLGLWLQKRRSDGGMRFTAQQPHRLAAEGQYPCIHEGCPKKLGTRIQLVEHVRGLHPRTALMYDKLLNTMIDSAAEDNPAVAKLLQSLASMKEPGVQSVVVAPAPTRENIDLTAGTPQVTSLGIKKSVEPDDGGCGLCDWKPKADTANPQKARYMHLIMKHRGELE